MPIGVLAKQYPSGDQESALEKYSANTTAIERLSGHSPNTVQLVTTLLRFIAQVWARYYAIYQAYSTVRPISGKVSSSSSTISPVRMLNSGCRPAGPP